ncbi:MAG TPA: ATP-binding protein [Verrucomicrobiae bacterium]|nr:ATP-binding protein [Verrucomicrobiae bacterium]
MDDELVHLNALCDILTDHGYETLGCENGKAAIAALQEAQFDLLLSDLKMPEIDGVTLLAAALKMDSNLVGIIMTGQGTIDTAVEAMKMGALDYILKPFKLNSILPVLARAVSVRNLRLENAALQKRILERTAELEAANKSLEAFGYSVSHDLRAPIRAMGGFASMLGRDFGKLLPAEGQAMIGRIQENAIRMRELIDGLLAFANLGRKCLVKKCVEPAGIARSVIGNFQSELTKRPVEIEIAELPRCQADPFLLNQVFVNLLSNALKYSRERNPAHIKVGSHQENGENVYFVQDNGAGFDLDYADNLFGVFQRFHRADQFEGSGVGLAIVKQIIERHGGRIWAETAPEKGATFYFTLGGNESAELNGLQANWNIKEGSQ